jgi:hypothetical protein
MVSQLHFFFSNLLGIDERILCRYSTLYETVMFDKGIPQLFFFFFFFLSVKKKFIKKLHRVHKA